MEQLRKALMQAQREREERDDAAKGQSQAESVGSNAAWDLNSAGLNNHAKSTEEGGPKEGTAEDLNEEFLRYLRQGNDSGKGIRNREEQVEIVYNETKTVDLDEAVLEKNRVISGSEHSEVTQAYKMLRTQVLQKLKLNEWNSLAVVSPRSGNGKSLTAINLAISLAKEVKHSVLLVDLDLNNPSLADYLGLKLELGITDYLLRDEPIKNILVNPGMERLVLLGGTESLPHSSEVLGSPRLIGLVEELKQRYPNRIVIFDLPPILLSDDTVAFSPYVDSMLMVVEDGATTPDDLQLCADVLGNKPLLGSVLNKG